MKSHPQVVPQYASSYHMSLSVVDAHCPPGLGHGQWCHMNYILDQISSHLRIENWVVTFLWCIGLQPGAFANDQNNYMRYYNN